MSVYLVSALSLGVCKIGYAASVPRRLLIIQTFAPAPVVLLAQREGCRQLESEIHRALRSDRVHGEWFRLTERTLSTFMETCVQPLQVANKTERPVLEGAQLEPASGIIAKLGGVSAVARLLGLHRTRVSSWRLPRARGGTDGHIPHWHHAKLIAIAHNQGVALHPSEFLAALGGPRGPLADPVISSSSCAVAGQEGTTDGVSEIANVGAEIANAHR